MRPYQPPEDKKFRQGYQVGYDQGKEETDNQLIIIGRVQGFSLGIVLASACTIIGFIIGTLI